MYYVGTYVIIILRYNNCHNNNIIKDIDMCMSYVYLCYQLWIHQHLEDI